MMLSRNLCIFAGVFALSLAMFSEESTKQKDFESQVKDIKTILSNKPSNLDQDYYDAIGQSIECLNTNYEAGSDKWIKERTAISGLYLLLLNKIDENTIPNYNYDDNSILSKVQPPDETGLPAGVDPAEIKDVKLRDKYISDIQKNREKADLHYKQIILRRASKLWTEKVNKYIGRSFIDNADNSISKYRFGDADKAEIIKLVKTVITDTKRRNALLDYVNKTAEDTQKR